MLACVVDCNKRLMNIRDEKVKKGEPLGDKEELVIFGNDVVGLFPNITSARTGIIVRHKVQESKLKFEDMNFKQASLYVSLNEGLTGDLKELRRYFPWRRKTEGTALGMNNLEVNNREKMGDSYWVWPDREPTERHRQMMMARAAEIGTRTIFENFMFTFGGKNYLQTKGGPIGARVTMCAARLVMEDWGKRYTIILLNSGLNVWILKGYVDDGRQGTSRMALGMRYNKEKEIFEVTEDGRKEDQEKLEIKDRLPEDVQGVPALHEHHQA